MANSSVTLWILSLAIVCSLRRSQSMDPMRAALKSVHCEARGYNLKVKVAGCQERLVRINTCLGTCLSFSTPSGFSYEQVKSCNCCQQIKTKKVSVELLCRDKYNPSRLVRYYHPIETAIQCHCTSC